MATGTSGDLLDDRDKHAQSVFRHEILRQYIRLFIAMPGSTAVNNRVVILDGFAGKRRSSDGKSASAELILQEIRTFRRTRSVSAYFVEKDRESFESLARVAAEYQASGLDVHACRGGVDACLDEVVSAATGAPLFLFLDQCGAGLPYDRLRDVLTGPRRAHSPQTEVLLNFSVDLSRRTGGLLDSDSTAGATWMDTVCGGPWWRSTATKALNASPKRTSELVAHSVATEYAERLAGATSSYPVVIPVRRRLDQQPVCHLIFLTRSSYGLWVFADAVGRARKTYLRHLGQLDDDSPGMLFTREDDMSWLIEDEHRRAVNVLTENVRRLLQEKAGKPFKLVSEARAVFGEAYGYATEGALARALRNLQERREIVVSRESRLRERTVRPVFPLRFGR